MSNADIRGRFIWHELMTTDPEAAGSFYSKVVPWKTQPSGMPSYTLWMAGKTQTGGLMALPEDSQAAGTPPHWLVYIGTPDVDATVAAAERLGGKVCKAPADIPNVGRFAVLADPQGATFAVYTPGSPAQSGGGGAPEPGEYMWHELATTDQNGAWEFYSELFGWEKGPGHDMGPMGVYQIFQYGGMDVGGIFTLPDASTPPNWLSYVRVASVDKAAAAAKAGGGRVLNGPMEVPGGSWIAQLLDPQGGAFAVVEPPKAAAQRKKPTKARPAAEAAKTAATEQPKPAATSEPASTMEPAAAEAPAPERKPPRKAGRKAAKKAAGKTGRKAAKRAAKRAAGKKSATRGKKTAAGKRSAAKRAAAKKSAGAKRGKSAAKKSSAAGKRGSRGAKSKGRRR